MEGTNFITNGWWYTSSGNLTHRAIKLSSITEVYVINSAVHVVLSDGKKVQVPKEMLVDFLDATGLHIPS